MKILFASETEKPELWVPQLKQSLPHDEIVLSPDKSVDIALIASPPPGTFQKLGQPKLVQSLWMGVEKLLADPAYPRGVPLAHLANFHLGLGVSTRVPATTLAEYVALVKKDPKAGYYASAAAGSIPHFLGVMFARAAGIEMIHVPYKGTANVLQALAAGEISAASTPAADIASLVRSGKARLLATTGSKRAAAFPDVPTFKEAGYDIEGTGWYALFAPTGIPPANAARLSKAAIEAMHAPALRERLEQLGLEPTGLGPRELAAIVKADYERWGPVIRASGFRPDN